MQNTDVNSFVNVVYFILGWIVLQVDTYGLCCIVHIMLHGSYMELQTVVDSQNKKKFQPKIPFKRFESKDSRIIFIPTEHTHAYLGVPVQTDSHTCNVAVSGLQLLTSCDCNYLFIYAQTNNMYTLSVRCRNVHMHSYITYI